MSYPLLGKWILAKICILQELGVEGVVSHLVKIMSAMKPQDSLCASVFCFCHRIVCPALVSIAKRKKYGYHYVHITAQKFLTDQPRPRNDLLLILSQKYGLQYLASLPKGPHLFHLQELLHRSCHHRLWAQLLQALFLPQLAGHFTSCLLL